jgi:hypothetical protein
MANEHGQTILQEEARVLRQEFLDLAETMDTYYSAKVKVKTFGSVAAVAGSSKMLTMKI